MQHVLLCHVEAVGSGAPPVPALSTRILGAWLRQRLPAPPWRVSVLDLDPRPGTSAMLEAVVAEHPLVVGISCYVWNLEPSLQLARRLGEERPDITVVLGGPQLSYDADDLPWLKAQVPRVDLIIQGEGEIAFEQFLLRDASTRPPRGTVLQGEALPELGSFGGPLLESFPARVPSSFLTIEKSRGCRYPCGFCIMNDYGGTSRMRPDDAVRDELRWAGAHGIDLVLHAEAYFNPTIELTHRRAALVEEAGLGPDVVHAVTVDYFRLTEPEVAALAGINAWMDIGVQSTSEGALRISRRGFHQRRLEQVLEWAAKHGAGVILDLIIGLPGDTLVGLEGSLRYLLSLGVPFAPNLFRVLPASELYRRRKELGIEYDPFSCYVTSLPTMAAEEIEAAADLARTEAARAFLRYARGRLGSTLEEPQGRAHFARMYRGWTLGPSDDPRVDEWWQALRDPEMQQRLAVDPTALRLAFPEGARLALAQGASESTAGRWTLEGVSQNGVRIQLTMGTPGGPFIVWASPAEQGEPHYLMRDGVAFAYKKEGADARELAAMGAFVTSCSSLVAELLAEPPSAA